MSLAKTSRINLREYRTFFKYFQEVLDGTPQPKGVAWAHENAAAWDKEFFTLQLTKIARQPGAASIYLRVHREVMASNPEWVKCSVGIKQTKAGKPFWSIELASTTPELLTVLECHPLVIQHDFPRLHFIAGGDENKGFPAATLGTITLPGNFSSPLKRREYVTAEAEY